MWKTWQLLWNSWLVAALKQPKAILLKHRHQFLNLNFLGFDWNRTKLYTACTKEVIFEKKNAIFGMESHFFWHLIQLDWSAIGCPFTSIEHGVKYSILSDLTRSPIHFSQQQETWKVHAHRQKPPFRNIWKGGGAQCGVTHSVQCVDFLSLASV